MKKPSANTDVKNPKGVNNNTKMKVTVIPFVIGAFITVTKGLVQGPDDFDIRKRVNEGYRNYIIIKIGLNTGKSPGKLRRRVVTQTPMKDHQLTLV